MSAQNKSPLLTPQPNEEPRLSQEAEVEVGGASSGLVPDSVTTAVAAVSQEESSSGSSLSDNDWLDEDLLPHRQGLYSVVCV